jgi:hypothetical protein
MTKENYKGCPSYYGGERVDNGEIIDLFAFGEMRNLSHMQFSVIKNVMSFGQKGGQKETAEQFENIVFTLEKMFKAIDFSRNNKVVK